MSNGETITVRLNENIASVTFGWCCALIVVCSIRISSSWSLGRKQTKRYCYFLLCAFLVLDSAVLAVLAWSHLIQSLSQDVLIISLSLLLWSIQIHLYFQLIINRICILDIRSPSPRILRGGVAVMTLLTNLAMLCFWLMPQINHTRSAIALWFPRLEKVIYIVLDVVLNALFIFRVRNRLMRAGLHKYRKLIHYNLCVIGVSLLCDSLLLGMQWFPGSAFMFVMIHPLVFLNKLMLEMSICEFMARISRETNVLELLSSLAASPRYQEFEESFRNTMIVEKEKRAPSISSFASVDDPVYQELSKDETVITVRALYEEKRLPRLPPSSPLSPLSQEYQTYHPSKRSNLSYYGLSI